MSGKNTIIATHLRTSWEAHPQGTAELADGEALIHHPDGRGAAPVVARMKSGEGGIYEKPMRLLIVEDEAKAAAFLRKGLTESGLAVDVATTGEDGLHCALNDDYDLIILDAMLPKLDGWKVLAELRAAGRSMPVLFLTARGAVPDRVKGLELGADDYLVKPYAFSELLARVRALLRRRPERQPDIVQIADLRIDLLGTKVHRGPTRIDLAPKEFALLSLLARRQGEVLSRALIAEEVWDMHFEGESNVVDVAVRRLRRKIDDPFPVKLIRTIRGMGYILEAP
jgi:two-component system, OmpR family, copper resistance phosphate regulon response regulator CusR